MQAIAPLDAFFDATAGPHLGHTLPLDTRIVLLIEGEGGGDWTLTRATRQMLVRRGAARTWDCRVRCAVHDFLALVEGTLDGRDAFLMGKLRVEGDVGLALELLRSARRTP